MFKPVPGLCDRCGLRYPLKDLKTEDIMGRSTGIRTCPQCFDASHPQLDTRYVRTSDKQAVPDSRSDVKEHQSSRAVFGWNPVGADLTSTLVVEIGTITFGASP
jgi:hypothetical protein